MQSDDKGGSFERVLACEPDPGYPQAEGFHLRMAWIDVASEEGILRVGALATSSYPLFRV